jgi:hypothetical protein
VDELVEAAEAVAALEAQLKSAPAVGQAVAVLKGVRHDFEAWEEGQIDGPIPPLATVESVQAAFKFVLVDKQVWTKVPKYTQKVHNIFDRHMGGGTSMSYKLFALFKKGLVAIRAALRSKSSERALCEAILLTKAMADNDEWYGDTDAPEQVVQIVRALSNIWGDVLGSELDARSWDSGNLFEHLNMLTCFEDPGNQDAWQDFEFAFVEFNKHSDSILGANPELLRDDTIVFFHMLHTHNDIFQSFSMFVNVFKLISMQSPLPPNSPELDDSMIGFLGN